MGGAWVGPLYWIQWAGDAAAYIPAGGGPVRGRVPSPDCAPPVN